jgi:hypothetical protein
MGAVETVPVEGDRVRVTYRHPGSHTMVYVGVVRHVYGTPPDEIVVIRDVVLSTAGRDHRIGTTSLVSPRSLGAGEWEILD